MVVGWSFPRARSLPPQKRKKSTQDKTPFPLRNPDHASVPKRAQRALHSRLFTALDVHTNAQLRGELAGHRVQGSGIGWRDDDVVAVVETGDGGSAAAGVCPVGPAHAARIRRLPIVVRAFHELQVIREWQLQQRGKTRHICENRRRETEGGTVVVRKRIIGCEGKGVGRAE